MLEEIFAIVASAAPSWALLLLDVWDRLRRRREDRRSDGRREDVEKP